MVIEYTWPIFFPRFFLVNFFEVFFSFFPLILNFTIEILNSDIFETFFSFFLMNFPWNLCVIYHKLHLFSTFSRYFFIFYHYFSRKKPKRSFHSFHFSTVIYFFPCFGKMLLNSKCIFSCFCVPYMTFFPWITHFFTILKKKKFFFYRRFFFFQNFLFEAMEDKRKRWKKT